MGGTPLLLEIPRFGIAYPIAQGDFIYYYFFIDGSKSPISTKRYLLTTYN